MSQANKPKKRDREVQVQFWLDPQHPVEREVIEFFEDALATEKLKEKALIINLVRTFKQKGWKVEVEPIDPVVRINARLEKAAAQLDKTAARIFEMLAGGQFTPQNQQAAQAYQDFQIAYEELDAFGEGISDNYVPLNYDEDEK